MNKIIRPAPGNQTQDLTIDKLVWRLLHKTGYLTSLYNIKIGVFEYALNIKLVLLIKMNHINLIHKLLQGPRDDKHYIRS